MWSDGEQEREREMKTDESERRKVRGGQMKRTEGLIGSIYFWEVNLLSDRLSLILKNTRAHCEFDARKVGAVWQLLNSPRPLRFCFLFPVGDVSAVLQPPFNPNPGWTSQQIHAESSTRFTSVSTFHRVRTTTRTTRVLRTKCTNQALSI